MIRFERETVNCDVLIIGGGMAGAGAAFEASYWAQKSGLRVVLVEKSTIERSGAVAMGLSAINCYIGTKFNENRAEDFVQYVRNDLMGICRDDLVYDIARNVDDSVYLFEKWGLPIYKTPEGRYQREGRWQILIHGESYKPIVAEAARKALGKGNLYERIFIYNLIKDRKNSNRIAGALGFSLRENKLYTFKARSVICAAGGATNLFRSHASGEGMGRIWYALWNTGSVYSLLIRAGATMTQMEHRVVVPRFKDGYGPVGMWSLHYGAKLENAYGEDYERLRESELAPWAPYCHVRPLPTPLRVYLLQKDIQAGRGPHYMRTDVALQEMLQCASAGDREYSTIESKVWENFLSMTVAQAHVWAAANRDPFTSPSEIALTEPYLVGSHAAACGAWVSGPEDVARSDFFWGYNRMTTLEGLFAVGDGVGASSHKFSSGSFTEGRIAGKAATAFAHDHSSPPNPDWDRIRAIEADGLKPLEIFDKYSKMISVRTADYDFLFPEQALPRLQKIMDEYGAGLSSGYRTNERKLLRGLELLEVFKEDLKLLAARDLHELMRCSELIDRFWCATAHLRHILFRQETRWPGFYERSDYPSLDDSEWRVCVNSVCDEVSGAWELWKIDPTSAMDARFSSPRH